MKRNKIYITAMFSINGNFIETSDWMVSEIQKVQDFAKILEEELLRDVGNKINSIEMVKPFDMTPRILDNNSTFIAQGVANGDILRIYLR
jgi:hypothetical protein